MKRFLLSATLAFAFVFSTVAAAADAGVKVPAHQRFVLPNGLTVLVLPRKDVPMIAFAVIVLIIFLGPFFVFSGPLRRAKRLAELQYGALVGQQGRLVRQKWIEGLQVKDDAGLLSAPELGPVADNISMFQMVDRMRALPVGKRALISVAVPVAIPLLVVVSLRVPIKDVLLGLLKAIA